MKILLVSHDGGRSGAPYLLLWLARWIHENTDHTLHSVYLDKGPLIEEMATICPTDSWKLPGPTRFHKRAWARFTGRHQSCPSDLLTHAIDTFAPDVVFLNTLVLGKHLHQVNQRVAGRLITYITHVHELPYTMLSMSSREDVHRQLAVSSRIIACAPCVEENLVNSFGLNPSTCTVIPEFLPQLNPQEIARVPPPAGVASQAVSKLREASQSGVFIFGFAGSPNERKGFDLFPMLLSACKRRFGALPFLAVWVGVDSPVNMLYEHDLNSLGVKQNILLVPGVPNALAIIGCFDALSLLSREDPYPVVALEAAALGVPTVCFRNSGGFPQFVADGAGIDVEYLNVDAFADALYRLATERNLREQLSERGRLKVFTESSISIVAPRILSEIEQTWSGGRSGFNKEGLGFSPTPTT